MIHSETLPIQSRSHQLYRSSVPVLRLGPLFQSSVSEVLHASPVSQTLTYNNPKNLSLPNNLTTSRYISSSFILCGFSAFSPSILNQPYPHSTAPNHLKHQTLCCHPTPQIRTAHSRYIIACRRGHPPLN